MTRHHAWLALPLGFALAACPASDPSGEPPKPPPKPAAPASKPAAPASNPASGSSTTSMKGTSPETREQIDDDGVVRRGVAVAHEEAMTVSAVMADADAMNGQTVTLTGEVTEVCVKKGCWMAIRGEDGGPTIRVTMKDYAYFVPKSSQGMNATVRGDLSVKTLDAATAQHYADDAKEAGEPAPEVEAGAREVAIASIGLELRP